MTDPTGRAVPVRFWTPARLAVTAAILVGILGIGAIVYVVTGPAAEDDPAALSRRFSTAIDWQACGDGLRCADVDAPLDWHDTTTGSISLKLIKHTATGTREGTLLVNPGGPGGSGVDFVGGDVHQAVDPALAEHFDVIGFDPRGVGESSPVRCYGAKEMDRYLYGILPGAIGSAKWLAASRRADADFAAACADRTGPLISHVDTESVARDLDLIRSDLGEKKLDYLGYSYGTYLGTIYAGLFPERVGRFVFDGADNPWSDGGGSTDDEGATDQAVGFDGDLRNYVAACIAGSREAVPQGSCPLAGSTDAGMTQVKSILDRVAASPLRAKDGRLLGDATLATAIAEALYDTTSWPRLTTAFRHVQAGDPAAAFALADDYNGRSPKGRYYDNSAEAFDAVTCLESPGEDSATALRKDAAKIQAEAPVLGKYQAYSDLLCAQWPTEVADFPEPVRAPGAGSILVIGSTGDPATPYADAVALAKQLKTGHLLTRVGDGHTAYDLGDSCIDSAVDSFLRTGATPAGAAARCD
ncbi:proteinase [Frondihabitans sucicola]|uniref:Proteinase n=1 Tax=Frondihabitans sucicola TaxID=1268041 RepID=A0ABN6XU19_9MICO|nr:alpha/beta hydrolase [Frondihabitans sucicola]BDZ48505.1 proteinase [Frondihabitans sucicola]